MNETVERHVKIARTLLSAVLAGNAVGTYTEDDTRMMLGGALADVGYALAVANGVEPDMGTQIDVDRAVRAAVQVVVEVEKKGVAA